MSRGIYRAYLDARAAAEALLMAYSSGNDAYLKVARRELGEAIEAVEKIDPQPVELAEAR